MSRPRIVIIGASSAIAEHCARLWARAAVELVLVGRDLVRVARVAADLRVRSPQSTVTAIESSFSDPSVIAKLAENSLLGQVLAAGLRSGIVWINCWMVRDLRTPFGGYKKSGIGREGGVWSFDFYADVKNTVYAPNGWKE